MYKVAQREFRLPIYRSYFLERISFVTKNINLYPQAATGDVP